ncbi:unnamed protein product [Closterium sp. NIES-64]|nr:unnamed protein product [Closterium sp. NIES-64]
MRRWRAISGGDLWKRVQQGGGHVHLVMDLCQGGDVWQRVQQGGAYGEREAAAVVGRLVGLLRDLHALGIMHRDVKPENVLLRREDDDVDVAVIDYGVSVFFNPGERFSEIVGSPFYIAPEVLHESYGPESDIWAAGVILFVLLSGVLPFWGDSDEGVFRAILEKSVEEEMEREGVWESVSDEAKDLVMRMLSKDAALRITADEILDVSKQISTASPVSPTPHPPSSPSPLSPCSLPLFTPPFCGPICFPPFCPPFLPPFPPPSPTPFSLFFPLPLSDATHYSKQQVPQRSSMKQKEGGGANELENGPLLVIVTRPPILPASLLPHSPSFSRHALQQVAGAAAIRPTHYSKQQVPQRSAVRRVEGGGAYELENVCIHARFKGGVTLHGVEDVPSDGDGLPLCNEAGCFTFPVTYTNDKLPRGKRGHSGWIDDATAVIMPLTAGNPWHFLHHAIPLSHVEGLNACSLSPTPSPSPSSPLLSLCHLPMPFSTPSSQLLSSQRHALRNSTAHLFPCLARGVEGMLAHASHIHGEGRHEGTMPDVDTRTHDTDVQGIHTHDARTHGAAHITATGISVPPPDYYSTRHFPWWPLLAATAPPGVTLYQVCCSGVLFGCFFPSPSSSVSIPSIVPLFLLPPFLPFLSSPLAHFSSFLLFSFTPFLSLFSAIFPIPPLPPLPFHSHFSLPSSPFLVSLPSPPRPPLLPTLGDKRGGGASSKSLLPLHLLPSRLPGSASGLLPRPAAAETAASAASRVIPRVQTPRLGPCWSDRGQRRPPLLPVTASLHAPSNLPSPFPSPFHPPPPVHSSSESKPHDLPHSTSSSLPSATSAPLSTSASLLPTRPPPRSTRPLMGIIARDRMRRLCHLPDLVRAAESAGFEVRVLQFEKFDVWQQIREAHQLDVLAGSHGAGMSNLIWLPPHAQVLEIYPARPTPFLLPAQNLNPASDYGRWASIFQVDHVVALQCPLQDEQCQVAEQVEDQVGTNVGEQRGGHVGVQVGEQVEDQVNSAEVEERFAAALNPGAMVGHTILSRSLVPSRSLAPVWSVIASLACFAIVSLAQQEPPSTGGGAIDPGAPIREKHRGVTAISEDINGQNLIPIHLDGSDPSVIESIASGGCKAGKCPEFHICEGTTPFGSGSGNFALCESKPLMTSAVEKTIQDMVFNLLSDAPPVSNCLDGSAIEKLRAGGASASHPPWFRTCPPQNPSAAGASSAAAAAAGAAGGSGKLESCVVPPYPGHVIMLRDVYVDLHGHVFNGTHRFVFGGGPRGSDVSGKPGEGVTSEFSYPKGTTASHRTMSHQLFGFDLASDSLRIMSHQLFGFDLASDLFGFDLASDVPFVHCTLRSPLPPTPPVSPIDSERGGDEAREAHFLFVHFLFVHFLFVHFLFVVSALIDFRVDLEPSYLSAPPLPPPSSASPAPAPSSPSRFFPPSSRPPSPSLPSFFPSLSLVPLLRLPLPLSPPPGPRPPLPPPGGLPSFLPASPPAPPLLPTLLLRSLTIDSHGNTRFYGLPSFLPSFKPHSPPPLFLSADGLSSGGEWLVVVVRTGLGGAGESGGGGGGVGGVVEEEEEIERVVVERFGAERVESYQGHMGMDDVKKLFNRARLLIGPSSLALSSLLIYPCLLSHFLPLSPPSPPKTPVKKLFNRARLLIGPSSLALSSLLFLPFNAALLELLPPPALNTSAPAGFGALAAAATGIIRYAPVVLVLHCLSRFFFFPCFAYLPSPLHHARLYTLKGLARWQQQQRALFGPGLALGPEGFGTLAAAVGIVRYAVPCGPHIATHSLLLSIPAPSICSITPGSVLDPEGFGTLAAAAGIVRYAVPCDPSLKGPAGGAAAGAAAESAGAAAAAGATGSAGTAGLGSSMSCRLQLVEGALDEIMSAHFSDVKRSGAVEGGAGGGTGGAAAASSSASSATPSLVPSPPPPSPAAAASPPPSTQPPPSAAAAAAAPPPPPPPPAAVVTHPTRSSPGSEKDEGPQPSPWYELNEQQWDEHREKIAAAEGGAGAFVTRLFNLTVPPEKDETEDGAGGGEGGAGGGVSEEGGGNQTAAGKSRAAPLFPDYSDHIPGTRLHTKRHVLIFNKWMECVLREGRWVFNATPRTLPWEYTGFMNMCDHKQVEKRKGKATWGADEMVLKGTSPDKWTVRETLKYEYLVPEDKCGAAALKKVVDAELGPEAASTGAAGAAGAEDTNAEVPVWKKFDGLDFCKRAAGAAETRRDRLWSNGSSAPAARDRWMDDPRRMHKGFTVYIVGDSLQNLFAATFLNHMLWHVKKSAAWALNRTICYQWVEHKPHVHCHMNFFNTSQDVCPGAFAGDAGSGGGGTGVAAAGAAGAAAADPAAAAAGGIGTNGSSSSDAGAFAMHFTSNRWLTVGDTFVAKESVPWSPARRISRL